MTGVILNKKSLILLRKKFSSNPYLIEVVKGSAIGLLVKMGAATSLFFMNLIAAQKLGPYEAGLFFLSITLVMFFSSIGRVGLDNALLRFVASEYSRGNLRGLVAVYRKSLLWAFFVSVLIAMLLALLNHTISVYVFTQPGFEPVFLVFICAIPLLSVYMLNSQALLGLRYVTKGLSVQNLILPLLVLSGFLIFDYATAMAGAFLYLFFSIAVCILSFYWLKGVVGTFGSIANFSSDVLWSSCKQLWLVTILNQVILWSSQIILGITDSAENVAFFSAAQRTSMLIGLILIAVNSIAAPRFSAMYSSGDLVG